MRVTNKGEGKGKKQASEEDNRKRKTAGEQKIKGVKKDKKGQKYKKKRDMSIKEWTKRRRQRRPAFGLVSPR